MVSTIDGEHYWRLSMVKKRRKRRHWDDDEKREIVAQARVPGVSVSRVARRYDMNANLVFKWLPDLDCSAIIGADYGSNLRNVGYSHRRGCRYF